MWLRTLSYLFISLTIIAMGIPGCSDEPGDDDGSSSGDDDVSEPADTTAPGDDDTSPGDDDASEPAGTPTPGDDDTSPGDDDASEPGDDDTSQGDDDTSPTGTPTPGDDDTAPTDTPAVDADGDGYTAAEDCDDSDGAVYPGAAESCNGRDDDCDDELDEGVKSPFYPDVDQDGYGDIDASPVEACSAPDGMVADHTDCDDSDPAYNPGANESCSDPEDFNCDGSVGYVDADSDGYAACNECNDADPAVHPGATEVCDSSNVDEDCNGQADDADPAVDPAGQVLWYVDADGDGYGDVADEGIARCDDPSDEVDQYVVDPDGSGPDDCDDSRDDVHPLAAEVCDLADNDCDTEVDEGVTPTWYADADGDGYGDSSAKVDACDEPEGYVSSAGDCNDADAAVNPAATEACNDVDDDCDGSIDDGLATSAWTVDADGDGYGAQGSTPIQKCNQPTGYVADSSDCNDANGAVNPGATEVCNQVDDDCDTQTDEGVTTTWYQDVDGDGYGWSASTTQACSQPSGYAAIGGDCDDTSASVNPSATEVCNHLDDDCDGSGDDGVAYVTWYQDSDGDGYGTGSSTTSDCAQPPGYVSDATDCNDASASIHPSAQEVCDASNVDEDCDGSADDADSSVSSGGKTTYYPDADKDGYGAASSSGTAYCDDPSTSSTKYATNKTDCNDADASINPGKSETLNGIDDNCDGAVDEGLAAGTSCKSIKAASPGAVSGVYTIDPDGSGSIAPMQVYCDQVTDGGGWIVFQRRQDGSVDFYRGWTDYQKGFGTLTGEHWLGNDKISQLTSTVASTLRVDLKRVSGQSYYAYYSSFSLGNSSTDYTLSVNGFSGTAPDCCGGGSGMYYHSGAPFSTKDHGVSSCAVAYKGAWWYRSCHYNNLNGYYYGGPHSSYADGIEWYGVAGYYESMVFTEMKMR